MEVLDQLNEWVKGNSVHNDERDECCPDFSCCNGVTTPPDVRERFTKAFRDDDEETVMQMLGMFLGNAFANEEVKVHIAGNVPTEIH